jgi:DNA mismatch repair protein MutL
VQHYALANPQLSFLLVGNGRDVIRVSAARSLRERAYQILGSALLEKLVEVDGTDDGRRVSGFVSNPQEQRSSRDAQYLFINCRFVRDQLLGRALNEAYRSMMPSGTHPAAVLFIEVPPTEVDVNVHPAKTEVRFLHEGAVLAFVRGAVVEALRSTQPITQVPGVVRSRTDESVATPARWGWSPEKPVERGAEALSRGGEQAPRGPGGDESSRGSGEGGIEGKALTDSGDWVENRGTIERVAAAYGEPAIVGDIEVTERPCATEPMLPAVETTPSRTLPGFGHGIKPLGQIRDSYIVATDEEGLLLVDQHVAHERVLFEQFRDARLARAAGLQPLLIPATLDLSPSESEAFSIVETELEHIGIETMRLSGRTIAVKTAPAGLGPDDVMAVVREVLTIVERERRTPTLDHIRDGIAAELACKAAIKVNMPLTSEKMQWLIDELLKTQNPMTCPHGRPIMMRMGLRDIERGFKRPV